MTEPRPEQSPGRSIRPGVWLLASLLVLACLLIMRFSRRNDEVPPTVESALPNDAPWQAQPGAPTSDRPRLPAREPDAQTVSGRTAVAISNELNTAREKLAALRHVHSDEHADVKGQLRALEILEQSALDSAETLELARARIARYEVQFGPKHPRIQAEQAAIRSLEQSAALGETSDVAEANAQLARLRVEYGEKHPAVQSQLKRVAELHR